MPYVYKRLQNFVTFLLTTSGCQFGVFITDFAAHCLTAGNCSESQWYINRCIFCV